jgi:NTE family protein
MKKLALVLSGGGFKGAFQLGALEYIRDNWKEFICLVSDDPQNQTPVMQFDIVSGVSVGSLNGFFVALNEFDQLVELWNEVETQGPQTIYTSDLVQTGDDGKMQFNVTMATLRKRFPRTFRNILANVILNRKKISQDLRWDMDNFRSIADNTPLRKKLHSLRKPHDKTYLIRKIMSAPCLYRCGLVPLDTGVYQAPYSYHFSEDKDLCEAILASTTMPVVWSPVEQVNISGKVCKDAVDGGIINISPLGDVVETINQTGNEDEYIILIINCGNGEPEVNNDVKNIAQIAVRSLTDITLTEIFNNDLQEFMNINSILEKLGMSEINYPHFDWNTGNSHNKRRKRFKAIVIQPDTSLGDTLLATPEILQQRRQAGQAKAKKVMNEFLRNMDARSWKMEA